MADSLINQAKKVFLTDDIESDDYAENLEILQSWESDIVANQALSEWQKHDVTKKLHRKAKVEFINASIRLASDRELPEAGRVVLFAKKDACTLIIEMIGGDAKDSIRQLNKEIAQKVAQFD